MLLAYFLKGKKNPLNAPFAVKSPRRVFIAPFFPTSKSVQNSLVIFPHSIRRGRHMIDCGTEQEKSSEHFMYIIRSDC